MKKIIFRYSTMNAGKTANLIMTYHNYKELGLNPVAIVPNFSKNKSIYSRTGMKIKALRFSELHDYISSNNVDCVLVDEVQFLNKEEIKYLNTLSIYANITIICYGLRTTSTGELFEGAKYLMAIADDIEELPTLCVCGRKARMNIRAINGIVDKSDVILKLREEKRVSYISLCRKCFSKYFNDYEENVDISHLVEKYDNTKNIKRLKE